MREWCCILRAQENRFEIMSNSRRHSAIPIRSSLRETEIQFAGLVKASLVVVCLFSDSYDNVSVRRRTHLFEKRILEFLLVQKGGDCMDVSSNCCGNCRNKDRNVWEGRCKIAVYVDPRNDERKVITDGRVQVGKGCLNRSRGRIKTVANRNTNWERSKLAFS